MKNFHNQVLSIHQVGHRSFSLSGVRPISIKDQLLRSTLLVQALADEKLIGKNQPPLLIYGGGIAGANAALTAAYYYGIPVCLIEKADFLFSTIDRSMRRIDLSEYDWPYDRDSIGTSHLTFLLFENELGPMSGSPLAAVLRQRFDNLCRQIENT